MAKCIGSYQRFLYAIRATLSLEGIGVAQVSIIALTAFFTVGAVTYDYKWLAALRPKLIDKLPAHIVCSVGIGVAQVSIIALTAFFAISAITDDFELFAAVRPKPVLKLPSPSILGYSLGV